MLTEIFNYHLKVIILTTIISSLLISQTSSIVTSRKHKRWQQQDRKLSESTDVTWNYCDVKCTYLQVLYPQNDFVIVYFQGIKTSQQFGVCYVKSQEKYTIWSQVVKNQFYQKTCGDKDYIDYFKLQNQYKLKAIMAIGKGKQLPPKYSPFQATY